jgi:hypothetical protein
MKTALVVATFLLAAPVASFASDQLIPAGSTVTCRVAEGKISSKTTAIGDPVLCTLDPVEAYGRSVFPYGSYLEGRFQDYKDPGHFVGKGWMELSFDRMYVGNRVYPVSAKVVQVPKYRVDQQGRILGNGHAVKDVVTWLIPVLWPIDLINLPRRGPRPVLQPETRLTLELMDDVGIPESEPNPYRDPQRQALIERAPQEQAQIQPPPVQQPLIYQNFQQAPVQQAPPPQQTVVYQQAPPQTVYVQSPPQVVYRYLPPPPVYYYPPAFRYYGPGY